MKQIMIIDPVSINKTPERFLYFKSIEIPQKLYDTFDKPITLMYQTKSAYMFGSISNIEDYRLYTSFKTSSKQLTIIDQQKFKYMSWEDLKDFKSNLQPVQLTAPCIRFYRVIDWSMVFIYIHMNKNGEIDGLLLDSENGIYDYLNKEYK